MENTAATPQPREWLNRNEAAAHLGVSPSTIDRLVDAGHLTRHKITGGKIARFDRADLDAVMVPDAPNA